MAGWKYINTSLTEQGRFFNDKELHQNITNIETALNEWWQGGKVIENEETIKYAGRYENLESFYPLNKSNLNKLVKAIKSSATVFDYNIAVNAENDKSAFYIENDRIILTAPCGIGRGGLKKKRNMKDYVTPLGEFSVDLILYKDQGFNRVSPKNMEKYKDNIYFYNLLKDQDGLSKLFYNMNSLDFDRNTKKDNAYGIAYIGLDSKNTITGPKMAKFDGKTYWFSIAIHGTKHENSIGKAKSGGCIRMNAAHISKLIESGTIKIGTKVIISDKKPLN